MPIDLSPYIADYSREPQTPYAAGNGTYEFHKNGLQDMLVRVLQAQFPDVVQAASGKLTNNPAAPGAVMEFSSLSGDINAQPRARYGNNFTIDRNKSGRVVGVRGATAQDVVENLAPLLHELYHARAVSGSGEYSKGAAMKGKEWQVMLENAVAAGFPSIKNTYGGGDKLEEFLATATAIKQLQRKGIPVEGRLKDAANNLPQLELLHPWLADYIKQWEAPEKSKSPTK